VSGYYEWRELAVPDQKKPAKQPFYVSRNDGMPFTFAGLLERWGPENLLTCTIITTDATVGIRSLHTCMPVILPKDGFEAWLSGSDTAVDPEIDGAVNITPVSPKMNKPGYNEPNCTAPLVALA